jgi:hypothetical protein
VEENCVHAKVYKQIWKNSRKRTFCGTLKKIKKRPSKRGKPSDSVSISYAKM